MTHWLLLECPDRKALAGDQKDVVIVTTVHTKDVPVPQARPARAVQSVNKDERGV